MKVLTQHIPALFMKVLTAHSGLVHEGADTAHSGLVHEGADTAHSGLVHEGADTAHSGLVHEGAATNCWAQNGDTHGHISETFKRRLLTNGTEQLSEKLPRVLLFSLFFFPFLSLGHVMLLLFSDLL